MSPTEQCFRFGVASRQRDSSGSARQADTGVARAGLGGSSLETLTATRQGWATEVSECLKVLLVSYRIIFSAVSL